MNIYSYVFNILIYERYPISMKFQYIDKQKFFP